MWSGPGVTHEPGVGVVMILVSGTTSWIIRWPQAEVLALRLDQRYRRADVLRAGLDHLNPRAVLRQLRGDPLNRRVDHPARRAELLNPRVDHLPCDRMIA